MYNVPPEVDLNVQDFPRGRCTLYIWEMKGEETVAQGAERDGNQRKRRGKDGEGEE